MLNKIKSYFNYNKFKFGDTLGLVCTVFSASVYRQYLDWNWWYFMYPFWFLAYFGKKPFMILSYLMFMVANIQTLNAIKHIGILGLLELIVLFFIFIIFSRDMLFVYFYKSENKLEIDKKYTTSFLIRNFILILLVATTWFIIAYYAGQVHK